MICIYNYIYTYVHQGTPLAARQSKMPYWKNGLPGVASHLVNGLDPQ